MTDIDNYDAGADAMVLMTMHAAKGLEFPVVFLPGFEDGIFPGIQTMFIPEEVEEDRRLCYVAITRAKKELFITTAGSRLLYGSTTRNRPSRFLQDIPEELVENHENVSTYRPRSFSSSYTSSYTSSYASPRSTFTDSPKPSFQSSYGGGGISANKSVAKTDNNQWQVGEHVSHKVFGNGTIQAVQPMGNDTLLTISFDKAGQKKVMATFAKLTKL